MATKWLFAAPAAGAVGLGIVAVTLFTPVSASMFSRFSGLEARYIKGEASALSVSQNGLWLRQGDEKSQSVIHAQRVADQGQRLEDVLVFLYGGNDDFTGRAPDLGALEAGKPEPKYGPRWLKGQPFYR